MARKKTENVKVVKVEKAKKDDQPKVVRCVTPFYDVLASVHRAPGDQWEVSNFRLAQLQKVEHDLKLQIIEVL